jgi:hypothetical protein
MLSMPEFYRLSHAPSPFLFFFPQDGLRPDFSTYVAGSSVTLLLDV